MALARLCLAVLVAMILVVACVGSAGAFSIDRGRTFLGDLWPHGTTAYGVHEQITAAAVRRGMPSAPPRLITQLQAGAENVDVTHHFDAEYHFDSASVARFRTRFVKAFRTVQSHLSGSRAFADRNPEFFAPSYGSYREIVDALTATLRALADDKGCKGCDRARLRRLAEVVDPATDDRLRLNPNPDPHPPTNPDSVFAPTARPSCGLCGKLAKVNAEYQLLQRRVAGASAIALAESARLPKTSAALRRRAQRVSDALRAYRAFQGLGHAFHAAQDFFAHSNYVELMAGVAVEQPIKRGTRIPVPQRRADFGLEGLRQLMGTKRFAKLESGATNAIWLGEGDFCLGSPYNPDTQVTVTIPASIASFFGVNRTYATPRVGKNPRPPQGLSYCHYASVDVPGIGRTPGLNKDEPGDAEPSHVNHPFARKAALDMTAVLWKSFLTTVRRPEDHSGGTTQDPTPGATVCRSPWQGSWRRVEHAGTMTITFEHGKLRFRFSWPWQTGEFTNLKLSGRTMSGDETKGTKASTFSIALAADGNSFTGTWRWADGSGGGQFSGTRIGTNPCPKA